MREIKLDKYINITIVKFYNNLVICFLLQLKKIWMCVCVILISLIKKKSKFYFIYILWLILKILWQSKRFDVTKNK